MTVFITGTNSGIGKALAEEYLAGGVAVYGVGRRSKATIRHENFHYLSLDLRATESISAHLRLFLNRLDALHLVILNAGVLGEIKEMRHTSLYELESVMLTNVWANKVILDTLITMNLSVRQIVGISSGAAVNASKGWGSYSLSKSALNTLLKLYSREMESTHITALAPGVVDTPMVRHITEKVDETKYPSAKRLKNGPIMTPKEAAQRLIEAFEKVKKYESGSFLDVRTME
ncbi:SDR family NAD(P)-dependent oxidoreductase [Hydrogenimonas urashimensis]|uniref:SDR family NAD(P)-dependent oxidoreductase n=1 Tax=Hydrogenimonas urashimensis TaxID=2740515 RepID=UPI001915038E|nr:SDR family NAD(P)-dependent oxidoreductase [Hydrogenimonas urashimensis]